MDNEPIEIPYHLYEQFEAIRDEGTINMFDRSGVTAIAARKGHAMLVMWLDSLTDREYVNIILGKVELTVTQ